MVPLLSPSYLSLVYQETIGEGDDIDFKTYRCNVGLMEVETTLSPNYRDYSCVATSKIVAKPYSIFITMNDGSIIPVASNVIVVNSCI